MTDDHPVTLGELVGRAVKETPPFFLVMRGQGRTWSRSWQTLAPAFDTYRGVIELTMGLGQWRWQFRLPQPRAHVPHPPWMLARPGGGKTEGAWFMAEDPRGDQLHRLDDKTLDAIERNLEPFHTTPAPKSTVSLIADCLRLYTQAMDERWPHRCFLGLWQLAEAIALGRELRGNTERVINRLVWHGSRAPLVGSGYRYTLAVLAKRRNEIVHRGIHRIDDGEVDVLKLATESALLWLLHVRETLPTTHHLREFYRLREASPAALRAARETAAFIERTSEREGEAPKES